MATERAALAILNAMEDELGLNRSASVTSTGVTTRQRLAFINATIEEAYGMSEWTGLERSAIFEFGGPTELAATLVDDSATITVADSSFLSAAPTAWMVTGESIQNNTRVLSAPTGTTILLDKTATASIAETLTFVKDTFDFPQDFDRWIPQTHWDDGMMWSMIGPTSSQFDAFQRNGIVGPFPRRQFRRQGRLPTAFRIFPPPTASGSYPGTLSFRYITNEAVTAGDGVTFKRFITADADTCILSDRLLILGGKWRWQQAKGFDFGPLQEEYYNWFDSRVATDRGESIVPLDGRGDYGYPDRIGGSGYNVPDGNFPSS
jgi:hypothetical protein